MTNRRWRIKTIDQITPTYSIQSIFNSSFPSFPWGPPYHIVETTLGRGALEMLSKAYRKHNT
jgi:hypothetical protein